MLTRIHSLLGVIIIAAGLFLGACSTPRITNGIRGQVADAETHQAIQGAAVTLFRTAHCVSGHAYSRDLPPVETRSDSHGRFEISGGVVVARDCIALAGWTDSVRILAPGYFSEHVAADLLKSGPVLLDRMRYLIELEGYRSRLKPTDDDAGSIWREALAKIRTISFRALDRPGVFASHPGAAFDQIAILANLPHRLTPGRYPVSRSTEVILAQDRKTGTILGWTNWGKPSPLPVPAYPGLRLVGGRRSTGYALPLFVQEGRIYYPERYGSAFAGLGAANWFEFSPQFGRVTTAVEVGTSLVTLEDGGREVAVYDLTSWIEWVVPRRKPGEARAILPGSRRAVSEVLPGAQPPIECMTSTKIPSNELVFIARAESERALYVLPHAKLADRRAERARIPHGVLSAEVTACAGGIDSVFVALRDQGILRLERGPGWESEWKASKSVVLEDSRGPLNFTSLAVGEIEPHWEVLYAVAGNEALYRFSIDGHPDQRIEVDLSFR